MNLVAFCFWAYWVVLSSTENSAIFLKYPTFKGEFFMFLWVKKM